MQISPDNSKLAIADGKNLYVFDTIEGKTLYSSYGEHSVLDFHPQQNKLLASDNNALVVWNLDTRECEQFHVGHDYRITAVSYFKEGNLIVSGDANGYCYLWQDNKKELLRRFSSQSQPIQNIVFCKYIEVPETKDNKVLTFADNSCVLWRHQPYNKQNVYSYVHSNLVTRADSVRFAPTRVEPTDAQGNFKQAKPSIHAQFFKTPSGAAYYKRRLKRQLQNGEITIDRLTLSVMSESERQEMVKLVRARYAEVEEKRSQTRRSPGLFDNAEDAIGMAQLIRLLSQMGANNAAEFLNDNDSNHPVI